MTEPTQILWTPAGKNLPSLGAKSLVDVSDGDTPNIRMPIRMLSIDTPEVTARSLRGASKVDDQFRQLDQGWSRAGFHCICRLHFTQTGKYQPGNAASCSCAVQNRHLTIMVAC